MTEANAEAGSPIRYDACATVMFGAYAVHAVFADGTRKPVLHGSPQHCLEAALRLNRELAASGECPLK
jgi:hypothetical protein